MELRLPRRRAGPMLRSTRSAAPHGMTQLSHAMPIVYSVTTSGATIDSQTAKEVPQGIGRAVAFARRGLDQGSFGQLC